MPPERFDNERSDQLETLCGFAMLHKSLRFSGVSVSAFASASVSLSVAVCDVTCMCTCRQRGHENYQTLAMSSAS